MTASSRQREKLPKPVSGPLARRAMGSGLTQGKKRDSVLGAVSTDGDRLSSPVEAVVQPEANRPARRDDHIEPVTVGDLVGLSLRLQPP